jgi:hypothetical protein
MRRLLGFGLGLLSFAWGVSFLNAPSQTIAPGGYATLVFQLSGEGEVELDLQAPPGYSPVDPQQTLDLNGKSLFFATVGIPENAPAGAQILVHVIALQKGHVVAQGSGTIKVAPVLKAGLDLRSATFTLGQTATLRGYVSNLGNQREVIELQLGAGPWPAQLTPAQLTLEPGESQSFAVTLRPEGELLSGYRYLVTVEAKVGERVLAHTLATATFVDPTAVLLQKEQGLYLVFGLQSALQDQLTLSQGTLTNTLSYGLTPSLKGGLSDYVRADLESSPLQGGTLTPFSLAGVVSLGLEGSSWQTALLLGPELVGLQGSFQLGSWNLGLGGSYQGGGTPGFGLEASLASLDPRFNFQSQLSSFFSGTFSDEQLALAYLQPLGSSFQLGLGLGLTGLARPPIPYTVIPSLNQSLTYRNPTFLLEESASFLPTLDDTTLALSGASVQASPLGFNGQSSLTLAPTGRLWSNNLTLYRLQGPLALSLTGIYQESSSLQAPTFFELVPQLSYGFRLPLHGEGSLVLDYSHTEGLSSSSPSGDHYAVGLGLTLPELSLSLGGAYDTRQAIPGAAPFQGLQASAQLTYTPIPTTQFSLAYTLNQTLLPLAETEESYGASWQEFWSPELSSQLSYTQGVNHIQGLPAQASQTIGATVDLNNLIPRLGLSLGYTLNLPSPISQTFTLGLAYDLKAPFPTPSFLVQLFGGRRSGVVDGRTYTLQGGREVPLAGVTVALGPAQAVSNGQGYYHLRLPPGEYTWEFPAGLPATLGLEGDPHQLVILNQSLHRDLLFVPVTNLEVLLYRGGSHYAPGDPGIPYGGVLLSGPVQEEAQADAQGMVFFSNLPAGTYTVKADPSLLPPGYQPSGSRQITLNPPQTPPMLQVGADQPPTQVITTFESGSLAVFAFSTPSSLPPGADLTIQAQVTGTAHQVTAQLLGLSIPLRAQGSGRFQGTLRIPLKAPLGLAQGEVVARSGAQESQAPFQVYIAQGSLFEAPTFYATAGSAFELKVSLLFQAHQAEVIWQGKPVLLHSTNGTFWTGELTPQVPGTYTLPLIADGRTLGLLHLSVSGSPQGGY